MTKLLSISEIQGKIIELKGQKVIIDSDLAVLYQVSTKRLMEQVKRNRQRFPADFMIQLTQAEWKGWKSQIATSGRFSAQKKKAPFVFTRNGANMVSAVLRSTVAIDRSIQIMRA
ncbi:MAG: ORF6N domain-containing protein, partial [Candidatus Margulisbacteria bacterium]|nr:ORF6N domain-containing protein [Candidatus Margulisiibacteriota bacterium]